MSNGRHGEQHDDALLSLISDFPAAADYLSTILLIRRDYGEVHNTRLANRLGVSKPAVSQAVSRLKSIGLVRQDSYGVIELSDTGADLAKTIIRRHYLIEHLLIKVVDFPWDKADDEALRLQTVVSGELADHLYRTFGEPSVCPHGNPFPGDAVEAELLRAPTLASCEVGDHVTVVRITEEGEAVEGLLRFCHQHDIRPGLVVEVGRAKSEGAMTIVPTDGDVLEIPLVYAEHLRVATTAE